MCDYCSKPKPKNWKPITNKWTGFKEDFKNDSIACHFDAIIDGNKLIVEYDAYSTDSSFREEILIKYCPMCGRKL